MIAKKMIANELASLECTDYRPIQTIKNLALADLEIAEDAGCDSCVHYKKGQCEIYVK